MKKLYLLPLILFLTVLLFVSPIRAYAASVDFTITWTQAFNDPNAPNADHWKIWRSQDGGSFMEVTSVPFVSVQPSYSVLLNDNAPDNQLTHYAFRVTMINDRGIETDYSNEMGVYVDLRLDTPPTITSIEVDY
jgi:hypothetical protein